MANNKEIIALNDFEHVLLKPTMYVGSIEKSDENVLIIFDNKIISVPKTISVGFYKLMNEIIDNAFDEAKRISGKMKNITVHFSSENNQVTVEDDGEGFHNPSNINSKTGLTNVETAMTKLRAGSNFRNEQTEENLIGTNGVGASVVNMLSDYFEITTTDKTTHFNQVWKSFISEGPKISKRKQSNKLGTTVSFIPRKDKFKDIFWDREYIQTLMTFRNFLKNQDINLSGLNFNVFFDNEKLNLEDKFFDDESTIFVQFKLGYLLLFPHWWQSGINTTRENFGTSKVSFVNSALCSGSHEKIVNDWINEIFEYPRASQFIDTFFVLDLPPRLVEFGDQNKTRFVTGRWKFEPLLEKNLKTKLKNACKPSSPLYKLTKERIDAYVKTEDIKAIKIQKRKLKNTYQVSDKYYAPSKKNGCLFVVEGDSSKGSILQKRKPESDGVYALRGKIKNARSVSDLASSKEIIDLMNILNIEPNDGKKCSYEKIIIATDWDPDGIGHIASLLINLFWKWFPNIIDENKLQILITPLISADSGGKTEYFYNTKNFHQWVEEGHKYSNLRYLKGLGSLNTDDWDFVMEFRDTWTIYNDKSAKKMLNIAFGTSSKLRKQWLQGEI